MVNQIEETTEYETDQLSLRNPGSRKNEPIRILL